MSAPGWVLGPGAVAAGRSIRGPVTVNVINGVFDRLRDAIFDLTPLAQVLDLAPFTGRKCLGAPAARRSLLTRTTPATGSHRGPRPLLPPSTRYRSRSRQGRMALHGV